MSDRSVSVPPAPAGQDQVRQLLQKIANLAARHLPTEDFYREYFGLLFSLPGIHAINVHASLGGGFTPVCGANEDALIPDNSARQQATVQTLVREAGRRLEMMSIPGGAEFSVHPGLRNDCPLRLVAIPVIFGRSSSYDALQGVELYGIKDSAVGDQLAGLQKLLQTCAAQSAPVLRHHRLEHVARSSQQVVSTARLLSEISGESDLDSLAVTVVNRAREILGVDRCTLLVSAKGGYFRVAAISNIPTPEKNSSLVRAMIQLAEDTERKDGPAVYRKASDKTEAVGTLADFFYYSRTAEVAVVPVQSRAQDKVGMLLAETSEPEGLTRDRLELVSMLASQVGPAVSSALVLSRTPGLGRLQAFVRWLEKAPSDRRRDLVRRVVIPLGIAAGILLFPLRFSIGGECRVAPLDRAAAVSETGGRLVEVLVQDGQSVESGQALARVDNSLLRKERDVFLQEAARFESEANRLRADDDRTGSQIAELQMRQARRQAEIREDMISRTVVASPLNGAVMSQGTLPKVGELLPMGGVFCLVGDPSRWEMTVYVPERDMSLLASKLGSGSLGIRYLLEAFPHRTMRAVLQDASSIAQMAEVVNNRNVFAVRVPIETDEELRSAMRAGYSGRAKIDIGWRPLIYVWTHDFFNWLRTRWV